MPTYRLDINAARARREDAEIRFSLKRPVDAAWGVETEAFGGDGWTMRLQQFSIRSEGIDFHASKDCTFKSFSFKTTEPIPRSADALGDPGVLPPSLNKEEEKWWWRLFDSENGALIMQSQDSGLYIAPSS